MMEKRLIGLAATVFALVLLLATAGVAAAQENGCDALPDHAGVTEALQEVVLPGGNGGFDLNMWATVVDRDGVVCVVTFSGEERGDQWPGSRLISAQKANTANAFSLPGLALSTANIFTAVQPGNSLFGLQFSNLLNPAVAFGGDPALNGMEGDAMVGHQIGGIIVFGGGLALYDEAGAIIGGIGVSGDSACADHNIAWKVRDALGLDHVPGGVSETGDDNIVYDPNSGWAHPQCGGGEAEIGMALVDDYPIGSADAMADHGEVLAMNMSEVHLFGTEELTVVPGAMSTMKRTADSLILDIDAKDLVPGEAYTVWWVLFNEPEGCSMDGCMAPDLGVEGAQGAVLYATGEVADDEGNAHFHASLSSGDTSYALDNDSGFPVELLEPSPGLIDPMTVEVHAVIRTHGAAMDDPSVQLSTFAGDCNPECANKQASQFNPPSSPEVLAINRSDVHLFGTEGLTLVPGASSTMERTEDTLVLNINAADLVPGEAYTVWWVLFNNPAGCSEGGCGAGDLGVKEAQGAVLYATGEVADDEGNAHFQASLSTGDTSYALDNDSGFPVELLEPSPGLVDPMGVEVHAVIRTHGAAMDDPSVQLSTFAGDCNPECANRQATMHMPMSSE